MKVVRWVPCTFEERLRWHDFRMAVWDLSSLDNKCYQLERRLDRLEEHWSKTGDTHKFRMERLRVRHELEMLKIEMEDFERRMKPFLEPESK